MLTGAGRALSLTERTARKLAGDGRRCSSSTSPCPSTSSPCATRSPTQWGRVDGVLHAIGFAPAGVPRRRLHGRPRGTTSPSRCTSSTYSLKALADAFVPLMTDGGVVRRARLRQHRRLAGLQLDGRGQVGAAERQPLPRQGARAAGHPLQPRRRRPGEDDGRQEHPRLRASSRTSGTTGPRWAGTSPTPSRSPRPRRPAQSDWFPATTGEIVHVDGGFHATGV